MSLFRDTNKLFAAPPAPSPSASQQHVPMLTLGKTIGLSHGEDIYSPNLIFMFVSDTDIHRSSSHLSLLSHHEEQRRTSFIRTRPLSIKYSVRVSTRRLTDLRKLYWGTHPLPVQVNTQQHPLEGPEDTDPHEHKRGWGQRPRRAGSSEKGFWAEDCKAWQRWTPC